MMAWVPRDGDQEPTALLLDAHEKWSSEEWRRLLQLCRAAYVAGMTAVQDPSPDVYTEDEANAWLVEILDKGRT